MDIAQLIGRAALVFALLGVTLYVVRRTDGGRRIAGRQSPLQVLGTTKLAKGASVSLVKIGGTTYAIGVTEHAVTLLTEADLTGAVASPVPAQPAPAERPTFAAALQTQLALRLRRSGADNNRGAVILPRADQGDPIEMEPDPVAETPDHRPEPASDPAPAEPERTTRATGRRTGPNSTVQAVPAPDADGPAPRRTAARTARTSSKHQAADGTAAAVPPTAGRRARRDAPAEPALEPACPPTRPARRPAAAEAPGRS